MLTEADKWIEAIVLEQDMGVSGSTIHYRTNVTKEWRSKMSERQGRNAPRKLIHVADLDRELQHKIEKRRRQEASSGSQTKESRDTLEAVSAALLRFPVEERAHWTAELARLAAIVDRYAVTTPKRVRDRSGKYQPSLAVVALLEEAACKDPVILKREPRRAAAPSIKTLDGWHARYREQGVVVFLRAVTKAERDDDKRKAAMSPAAVEWVNNNWRSYRSPRHLYRALEKLAKRHRWSICSESTMTRRWQDLPRILLTAHLEGQSAYTAKWAPYVPRTVGDLEALQVLCGDHSQRDVVVLLRDGKTLARPWLTLWQCMRTGLLWGWHLDLTPSSYTIGAAYANGVKTFGAQPLSRPDDGFYSYLYTDRGRDYRSHHLDGSIDVHREAASFAGCIELLRVGRQVGLLKDFDIKRILARGYNAKEKLVERVHRDISDWEENTFEEWCGRNAKFKPEPYREMYAQHQKYLKDKREYSPFIGIDEYRDALAGWLHGYNVQPHTRSTLNNARIVPLDEYRRLYTTHYSISEKALALLLMKVAEPSREIRKNGVELFNFHYLHPEMDKWKGKKVEVRYDDANYSRVWVVLPDGKICEAEMVERSSSISPNKQTLKTIAEQAARERRLIREHRLLSFSMARGETTADRVASEIAAEQEDEAIEAIAAQAGGGGASVHKITRFDCPTLRAVSRPDADFASVEPDDSIFESGARTSRVREFDYED